MVVLVIVVTVAVAIVIEAILLLCRINCLLVGLEVVAVDGAITDVAGVAVEAAVMVALYRRREVLALFSMGLRGSNRASSHSLRFRCADRVISLHAFSFTPGLVTRNVCSQQHEFRRSRPPRQAKSIGFTRLT